MARLSNNEAAATGWTHRRTVDYTDITDASTTQTLTLTVPAGCVVCNCGYYLETNFDGGATSELTLTVGSADPNGFLLASSIHQDGTVVTYAANTGIELIGDENVGTGRSLTVAAADTIDMLFTATGANLSVMTQGRVHIWFDIKQLIPGGHDIT